MKKPESTFRIYTIKIGAIAIMAYAMLLGRAALASHPQAGSIELPALLKEARESNLEIKEVEAAY